MNQGQDSLVTFKQALLVVHWIGGSLCQQDGVQALFYGQTEKLAQAVQFNSPKMIK